MTVRYSDSGPGSSNSPLWFVSSSSGTDGKYETFEGHQRLKWNNYDVIQRRSSNVPGHTASSPAVDYWLNATAFSGTTSITANEILDLQGRLLERVKGHSFNMAVEAAQGKQTVEMVTAAIGSVGGAISDLKKGKFESAARRFGVAQRPSRLSKNDVAGRWLELQYGWIPLFGTVFEAAKAYAAITNKPRVSRVVESITRKSSFDSSGSPTIYTCKGIREETLRITYEFTESMSTPRSLGLLDPATVVWELIPYSFVVDWFLPIGDYLSNLNQIPNLRGRFMTTKVRKFSGSSVMLPSSGITWLKEPVSNVSEFTLNRVASTGLTVPTPVFNSIPKAMSPSRIYNAIALVAQRLR